MKTRSKAGLAGCRSGLHLPLRSLQGCQGSTQSSTPAGFTQNPGPQTATPVQMDARAPEVPCGDVLQNAVSDACPRAPWTEVNGFRVLEGIEVTAIGVLGNRSREPKR
ncbi:hypothetical protein ACRRTK_021005 [Alexandromys fortis]